jgi:hypothetical protein
MLKIETTQNFKLKVMQLETLASDHERFRCKRGKFQAPETCSTCLAYVQALSILNS